MVLIGVIFLLCLMCLFALAVYFLYMQGYLDFLKRKESSREILDRRYASGEITEEEYLRMKDNLIEK